MRLTRPKCLLKPPSPLPTPTGQFKDGVPLPAEALFTLQQDDSMMMAFDSVDDVEDVDEDDDVKWIDLSDLGLGVEDMVVIGRCVQDNTVRVCVPVCLCVCVCVLPTYDVQHSFPPPHRHAPRLHRRPRRWMCP